MATHDRPPHTIAADTDALAQDARLEDAPPGSSTVSSSPSPPNSSDNPVQRLGRSADDVVVDKVRQGRWKTEE